MTTASIHPPTEVKPLRLWPGVLAVVLQWLVRFGLPAIDPDSLYFAVMGGILGGAGAVLLWWLFFSRAPWSERIGALVLMVAGLYATNRIVHPSISHGAMGMLLPLMAIPVLCLALVGWAVASRYLGSGLRRVSLVATMVLACGVFTLIRTGGMSGEGDSDLHWRWTPTPEDRLLDAGENEPVASSAKSATGKTGADPVTQPSPRSLNGTSILTAAKTIARWPGFRGPHRDGIVRGVRIATDWSIAPPVELWHGPVGPGWSSFAVQGGLFYTQEQRGPDEIVACYEVTTGKPVWKHRDRARFWESNAGAGPRATPTLSNGRVYTLGATGIVNALDAADGSVVWSRNAQADTGAKLPGWGFSSSPLVVNDLLIVAARGRLIAYELATGKPRWHGPTDGWGYSSPHLATLGKVQQILLLDGAGAISVAPQSGALLWKYAWQSDGIVQPALTAEGDVLIGSGSGFDGAAIGVRRIAVAHGSNGWTTQERWTSMGIKPYFNDFVLHKGHAYGFDGSMIACIDLADGTTKWKGGRYGHGQVILLADQDLLLVLSERGDVALVGATPEQFRQLARIGAIKGKTWNHPALAGDVLLVRNDEVMAAFRLPPAGR